MRCVKAFDANRVQGEREKTRANDEHQVSMEGVSCEGAKQRNSRSDPLHTGSAGNLPHVRSHLIRYA